MAQRHLATDGAAPAAWSTIADNTDRTPSTTRDTHVIVICDFNTMAAGVVALITPTVGGVAHSAPYAAHNMFTVAAARITVQFCLFVPRNMAYKVDSDNTTNLTIRIQETLL